MDDDDDDEGEDADSDEDETDEGGDGVDDIGHGELRSKLPPPPQGEFPPVSGV